LEMGSCELFAQADIKLRTFGSRLPKSQDYRCEPQAPSLCLFSHTRDLGSIWKMLNDLFKITKPLTPLQSKGSFYMRSWFGNQEQYLQGERTFLSFSDSCSFQVN
jgi:hypothetical protein